MSWLERVRANNLSRQDTDKTDICPSVSFVSTHYGPDIYDLEPQSPSRVAPPAAPGDDVSDSDITFEATYGRVTCLRCANLTRSGVCRARSTPDTNYTPMQYEPVLLWRRCEEYKRI